MTPGKWKTITRIFSEAARLEPSQRKAYLNIACAKKPAVRTEVESLLTHHDRSGHVMGLDSSVGGKILGHYQILELIREGGMGLVYKALDTRLERRVAIKVLPAWAMGDPESRARFLEEARSASALNHPGIVTVHEIAQEKNVDFIVMEYVAGETLDRLIPARGIPVPKALNLAVQIADVLSAAHESEILHGDLKPSNIMITDDGRAKLLDFGLARRPGNTIRTEGFGTKAYMAPEQRTRAVTDKRSEIFSFGVILYEMLCGRHPFGPLTRDDRSKAIRTEAPQPVRPKIPLPLARTIQRCIEKDPTLRFQSVHDLLVSLKQCSIAGDAGFRQHTSSTGPEPPARDGLTLRQARSEIHRISYRSLADSRAALDAITRLLHNSPSADLRRSIVSAMKDLILDTRTNDDGVLPASIREIRKLALELLKLAKDGDLRDCFEKRQLEHLDLYGMNFSNERLTGMSFRGSFLVEASFRRCALRRASFARSYLRNADFTGAEIAEVDLTDADWFNAVGLTRAQFARIRRETLVKCPASVSEMHHYLESRYLYPFESWSTEIRQQLTAVWHKYLRPGGLRDVLERHTRRSG
jgi:serine/threonine protein kinase